MSNGENGPPAQGGGPEDAAPQQPDEGSVTQPPGHAPPAPVAAAPPVPSSLPTFPPQQAASAAPHHVSAAGYPIDLGVDVPERIARWRPLVQWLLAVPLFVIAYVLRLVAEVCAFVGWFAALFTGKLPDGLAAFIAGYYRYYWRAFSYGAFLREKYPPFGPALGYEDPGGDPAWFEVRGGQGLSRLAVLFRIILVIPQLIALFFLGIALFIMMVVAFFVVLFTGRWPAGLRDFIIGVQRWALRVDAWFYMLADPYPPFSLN